MEERQEIVLGTRVDKNLHSKIVAEQKRIQRLTGIKPSMNKIVNMLIEKGLEANGRKR